MGNENSSVLVAWYTNHIGEPTTDDEVYGYWAFVVGLCAGLLGIILFLLSESSVNPTRAAGIVLGAFGLLLLIAGPIIRLPLRRTATLLTYLGMVVGLLAIAWFVLVYPDNWVRGSGRAEAVIGLYAVGLAVLGLGGVVVPLITDPGGRRAAIEAERDAERSARERAESDAESATERASEASTERDRIEAELQQIRDSQSQFELYTDVAGEYRWRLRHRNTNVIATGGEGYASKQKARQGLSGVKRDAFGASVLELEATEYDVDASDDATDGEDAPEFVPDAPSQATYEAYEDTGGEYRWRLIHENGNIIADSGQGYSSRRNVERALERLPEYTAVADYLRVDPTAFELYRDSADEWRWRLIHENGNILADGGQGYASRQKARQGVESVRQNAPEGNSAEFEVYEDAGGEYRWRLRHDNGNIIADSGEGYASESGAEEAVDRVQTYAPDATHLDVGTAAFEIYEDNAEEWRWRLRHRNGRILGDSGEGYPDRGDATAAVGRVKRHGHNADVEWQE